MGMFIFIVLPAVLIGGSIAAFINFWLGLIFMVGLLAFASDIGTPRPERGEH